MPLDPKELAELRRLADEATRDPAPPALREAVAARWHVSPGHVAVDHALVDMPSHDRVATLLEHRGVHLGEVIPALLGEVERLTVDHQAYRAEAVRQLEWKRAQVEKLRALVREVEWSRPGGAAGCLDLCPVCHGMKPHEVRGLPVDGHTPGCRLAAALKET